MCNTCKKSTYKKNNIFYHSVPCCKIEHTVNLIGELKAIAESGDEKADWGNSLYVSSCEEVAKGYIVPKETTGGLLKCSYYLVTLRLKSDLNYISCNDENFAYGINSNYMLPQNEINNIESLIGCSRDNMPFMAYLGLNDYAFECYHDADMRKELIIPSKLITDDIFSIAKIEKWEANSNGEIKPVI